MAEENINCCVTTCDVPLDQNYWNNQYVNHTTGWDLGEVSPPIKSYFNSVKNKEIKILIPGCGNSYEADYLLQQGFTNITVIDIAPKLVEDLQNKHAGNTSINIVLGDFFDHQNQYDVIIEQTFFCALPPFLREKYVTKMHQLLNTNGLLVGLLFNRTFEKSPPFGGSKEEYQKLFKDSFEFSHFDICNNSIAPRANTELWVELKKNSQVKVNTYTINGITCMGCKKDIVSKIEKMPHVLNASINESFSDLLIVSTCTMDLKQIENVIKTEEKTYTLTQN